jgi:hypothetical protein
MNGHIALDLIVDGKPVDADTMWWSSAGSAVLTLTTTLAAGGEALELISTFLSHPDVETIVNHLTVAGALDAHAHAEHRPYEEMNTLDRRRACCYEHLQELADELRRFGHDPRVLIDDSSFEALEGTVDA